MKSAKNAFSVGLFTVVMAIGLYYSIRYVSDFSEGDGEYHLWAVFKDASGLVVNSRIEIAGIPVGRIESISLANYEEEVVPRDGGAPHKEARVGARVNFVVKGDVAVYENGRVLKSTNGLLGNQLVVVQPGDVTKRKLVDGDRIMMAQEAGLMGNLGEISGDISEVTRNLRNVFGTGEGGKNMGEVLTNLREISVSMKTILQENTENVNRTMTNIEGIAADARPSIRLILEDLKEITAEVRHFVETSSGKADSVVESADGTLKDVRGAVAKLDRTMDNLEKVSESLRNGESTAGRLLTDDKLIDDVEEVVENAGGLVKGITDLKTIIGVQAEYNFRAQNVKSGLQLRLQPREDKYYLFEAVYDPGGSTTTVTRNVTTDHPATGVAPEYTETIRTTKSELLFSFMFARRLKFATFRFGFKENSGGLGLDLHMLRDKLELTTDLYRFGNDTFPVLKHMLAFEFLRNFYVIGGVSNVLNQNRDVFVGLMLRFDDEDLKTVLPFAPSGM